MRRSFCAISLTIESGWKAAVVCRTGARKSTLVALLLGLYSLPSGDILYEGLPRYDLEYRALRGQFGVVLQDSFLWLRAIIG